MATGAKHPAECCLEALIDVGSTVQADDPETMHEVQGIYDDKAGLKYCAKQIKHWITSMP